MWTKGTAHQQHTFVATFFTSCNNIHDRGMSVEVDALVIDLEVIGQLRGSDKLGVHTLPGNTRLVVDAGTYTQSLRRWYHGSDRDAALRYVGRVVERCQSSTCLLEEGRLRRVAATLDTAVANAINGLTNLQTTYANDSTTVATIGLLVAKLRALSDRLQAVAPTPATSAA